LVAKVLLPLLAILSLLPAVPAWAALVAGILLALAFGNPYAAQTKPWTPRLLAWSVVGLGAGMNLVEVGKVGLQGFAYTSVGIVFALTIGLFLGKRMGVAGDTSMLISVGTAICGGSAIVAVAPVIHAGDEDTSVALATVFLLNALALILFPMVGHFFHLAERPFGLWAALAIHDTSSVVAAGATYGPVAELVATTTKLARALWIVPVGFGMGLLHARLRDQTDGKPRPKAARPWFILGFLLAAGLVTFVPRLNAAGHIVNGAAHRLLVFTLFLLGTGITREALRKVGARPLLQGAALWFIVGAASLVAVLRGWIA
jgi:uncharacterized integral membrane protein (TIGR00698 family)